MSEQLFYAGIGSRRAPKDVQRRMRSIAAALYRRGWTLRTGGADGPDTAFMLGHFSVVDRSIPFHLLEVYLPWQRFNDVSGNYYKVSPEAIELAISVSPHIKWQNRAAQLLHGRNSYQVLGYDLKTPAKMIVCWTPKGKVVGGTATALKIAMLPQYNIPIYNLALLPNDEWVERLQSNGYCTP